MGGIFDRWINIIPESIILNKIILPKISNGHNVEVIPDYYKYEPQENKADIAPDLIGIVRLYRLLFLMISGKQLIEYHKLK